MTVASCDDGARYTAPVGGYRPNRFGLHDMHGNVLEWTEDCYHDRYAGAPSDGAAWTAGDCALRVVRGGSWNYGPRALSSANRVWANPGPLHRVDSGPPQIDFVGFRLAQDR